jgi:hypothetical protein
MSKSSKSGSNSVKIVFGKKGHGKAKKNINKHSPKVKKYRGQGR